jgi:hypothetical protein
MPRRVSNWGGWLVTAVVMVFPVADLAGELLDAPGQ